MNTNMTGFRCFSKIFLACTLDESRLSIGRVIPFSTRALLKHTCEYLVMLRLALLKIHFIILKKNLSVHVVVFGNTSSLHGF